MSEGNTQVALAFSEAFDRGDVDAAASFFAEEGINHGMRVTRDQVRAVLADLRTTFDLKPLQVHTTVTDGEWVVQRTTMSGTHRGKNVIPIHMLSPGTEPSGRSFSVQVIHMFRFAGGKIIEHWAGRDDLGLHWQLGLLPVPDWYKARLG